MFEWKIQKAWDDYRLDFGLGRTLLLTAIFNVFLFFIGILLLNTIIYEPLLLVLLSQVLIHLREYIVKLRQNYIFFVLGVFVAISIVYNYLYVGLFDQYAGGLVRFDAFFSKIDMEIFNAPVANYIYSIIGKKSLFTTIYYDLIQLSYFTFYLYPIFGGIFYYAQLNRSGKFKIGRYAISIILFFNINYLLYLLVPVSGPQYFLTEPLSLNLPFSNFGLWLNGLIYDGHPNFIDCFPSGHAGISILVTAWMFKIKNHYRYIFLIFCILMINATLALGYHYLLDILAALPLTLICYKLSYYILPIKADVRTNRKWRL